MKNCRRHVDRSGREPPVIRLSKKTASTVRASSFLAAHRSSTDEFCIGAAQWPVIIDLSANPIAGAISSVVSWAGEPSRAAFSAKPSLATIHPLLPKRWFVLPSRCGTSACAVVSATVLQPVSAWGNPASKELETQTSNLLSLQTPGKQLFDSQLAFSTLDRFGPSSPTICAGPWPIFATRCMLVSAELRDSRDSTGPCSGILRHHIFCLRRAGHLGKCGSHPTTCKAAGFSMMQAPDSPNNLSVADESAIQLAQRI